VLETGFFLVNHFSEIIFFGKVFEILLEGIVQQKLTRVKSGTYR
jgi:hypothetical protein